MVKKAKDVSNSAEGLQVIAKSDSGICAPPPTPKSSWQKMTTAPLNATWVQVKTASGKILKAHWASGGGEEQPPFRGWFVDAGNYMRGIDDPVAWRPLAHSSGRRGRGAHPAMPLNASQRILIHAWYAHNEANIDG